MPIPDATEFTRDNSLWATLGAGLTLGLAGAYRIYRRLKGDVRADRRDAGEDRFLQTVLHERDEAIKRADAFAVERNTERELRIRAEAALTALQKDFEVIRERAEALAKDVARLSLEKDELDDLVNRLRDRLDATLRGAPIPLPDQSTPTSQE